MASSLRCYGPVSRVDAIAASKAPQSFRLRNAPLALVDVTVAIRVHLLERRLEARRHEQVLEVRVAAVDEELDDALVALDGRDDLLLLERAAAVVVDHLENFTSRVQELRAEFGVRAEGRPFPPLALHCQLLQALREAALDSLVPFLFVDLAGVVRVQDLQRLLQPRRVQQELEVIFAARRQEPNDFLIRLHGLDDLGLGQRSAAVLVDELEALPGGRKELAGKFRDFLLRRLRLRLAGRGALLELVLQRDLDARLPFAKVDVAVVIRVHRREGGLEAVRHEQILQVFVAAVDEKVNDFLIGPHGAHLCVNQSVSPTHRHGWRRVDVAKATIKPCTGAHDLLLLERAGLVFIDHLEASASRVKELSAEFGIVP